MPRFAARPTLGLLSLLVAVFATPAVAHADAAGPTDYRSDVVSVVPETPALDVSIVGFDAFVMIEVAPGATVEVPGYQSEPFVRVLADGTVEENERSPTVYLSRDRRGGAEVPDFADAALPPSWKAVATGGTYAWHDHRAHWMGDERPLGAPGDVVQTGTINLVVGGAPVAVTVETTWVEAPAQWPLGVGLIAGAALIAGALLTRRLVAWLLLIGAVAALGIGWWQFSSLPAQTDPLLVWWLLPAVAAVSALIALVLGRSLFGYGLVVLGGLELATWVFVRRGGVWRALIPTDAPQTVDRAVLALAAVLAAVSVLGGVLGLYRSGD